MREIILEISSDGNDVRLEVAGVCGPDCKTLTAPLEQALGLDTSRREEKPEMRQRETLRVRSGS